MDDAFTAQAIKLFTKPELFDSEWYQETYPDVALSGMDAYAHYKRFGVMLGRAPNLEIQRQLQTMPLNAVMNYSKAIVAHTAVESVPDEFDAAFYLQTNPNIDHSKLSPYAHFKKYGHKDLRNPSEDFDIVWYLQNYGHTFNTDEVDAFTHYLQEGKSNGFIPHPPRQVNFNKAASCTLSASPRRACLFAAYDPDGYIDEYVLIYLRELAKHTDVFYMADCEMPKSELAKLEGIVKGAWAWRHAAYDFGSYSILARDLVGWKKLAKYDEVVFANDSCYLVQPLAETFARMAEKSCAWWGLQATKGVAATRPTQRFPASDGVLDIDHIRDTLLDQFEYDPVYDFHIGSYFMAFRGSVIKDVRFQRVINAIQPEKRKHSIVIKYEVGITHFLIGCGYEFGTWAQTVTQQHPVYTDVAFDLLAEGFPLFKRFMLAENPYKVSAMAYWKVALTQAGSLTSIAQVEDNYLRVSNAEKIYRNLNIIKDGEDVEPPMGAGAFLAYDKVTPKYDNFWGFPVCVYDHTLSDNSRAVFECIKDDPKITKVVFTRGRTVNPGGVNVIVVPLKTLEGQIYLARCRNLFVRHGPKANLEWPVSADHHNIINLWHGIPLKRIGMASLDLGDQRAERVLDNRQLRAVICASDVDRLAMSAAYAPKAYEDIWVTGLPRHDFITKPEIDLPAFLRNQLTDIAQLTGGRGLILFCPTFRNDQKDGYYNFTPDQVATLSKWLTKHNMVMGIREHPADKTHQYSSQLVGDAFIRVSAGRIPDVEMLYRQAQMMVTDYSSCFIDYMLTGRPMISFAYDLEAYKERERGLFYDLEDVFPGPVSQDFNSLLTALQASLKKINSAPSAEYVMQRKFFLKHMDGKSSDRVVERTKEICSGSDLAVGFRSAGLRKIPKSIVFLYSISGNITNRYRIFALISDLRAMGWTCHAMDINRASLEVVGRAEFVSICRLKMNTRTMDIVGAIRETGGKVIYDTDDVLHDDNIFMQSEYFLRDPKMANKLQLLSKNCVTLMEFADGFTVTTPALLETVKKFGRPAAIVNNSLSPVLLEKYADRPKRDRGKTINLSYLAGTATHSRDFQECKAALLELLLERPDVVLHIVGSLDVDDISGAVLAGQVREYGLMPYAAMHEFLSKMDINLAPLTDTKFNDAKSALKAFEAALHRVPTIASPSATYRATITDRKTGYLARSLQDWRDALFEAVDDSNMRDSIGDAAYSEIVPVFSAKHAAKQLSDFLEGIKTHDK